MNYKNMTEEEITYQLEWSDENEFGTNYAKFLREENKQLKETINNALDYIKWHYDLGTKENVEFCLLRDRLLEILEANNEQ